MLRLAAVVALGFALVAAPLYSQAGQGSPVPARPLARVAVLALENRSYEQVIGNPSAPFLNGLARKGALATHYYAITHPSLPNYLALTTGGHANVTRDCATCRDSGRSLANQLEAAGIPWRAYFENMHSPLATHWTRGVAYNPHYNPFAYTQAVRAPDPVGDVTNFATLRHDLARNGLPRFAWIAPNIWHDGHSGRLARVDRFARSLVPRIVRALGPHGVLFITWDEGPNSDTRGAHGRGGGHVALIAVGPEARPGAHVGTIANHYALLRTIESALGLRALGHARDSQTPILNGLLRP